MVTKIEMVKTPAALRYRNRKKFVKIYTAMGKGGLHYIALHCITRLSCNRYFDFYMKDFKIEGKHGHRGEGVKTCEGREEV